VSNKRKGGLGRGLEALLPRPEASEKQLPISDLRVSAIQPRKRFDDAAMAELVASVREKGIVQPLLVRPHAGSYEIVAGERRYRAAQQAGLSQVPVVVRDLDDQQALEIAIIENLQREDLDALEEAEAYQRLLGYGRTQEEVASALGKSRSAVANALRLLTLPEDAKEALAERTISAGHARAILAQPDADRSWALQQIRGRQLSVRQAEGLKRAAAKKPSDRERDQEYLEVAEQLTRQLGTRVVVRGGRRGAIELRFHNHEELEQLLALLGYRG
jgi:ParB family chromosome partitioning protein